jgi:hypothetical protein
MREGVRSPACDYKISTKVFFYDANDDEGNGYPAAAASHTLIQLLF